MELRADGISLPIAFFLQGTRRYPGMWEVAGKIILLCAMLSFSTGHASFPDGWATGFSGYYKYIPTPTTWEEAEIHCQSLTPGAHLASVHSQTEDSYIQQLVFNSVKRNPEIWIGASDKNQNKTFLWTDGSPWDFQAWHQGQPSNSGGQESCLQFNFVTLRSSKEPGLWNDVSCTTSMPFVCKAKNP
ncbi:lectin-like [Lissotriton helveticus]